MALAAKDFQYQAQWALAAMPAPIIVCEAEWPDILAAAKAASRPHHFNTAIILPA
jgi:hypothetical protein